MFLVILLYALFASVFVIAKTGLQFAEPLFFVGSRMTIAGIILFIYMLLFKRSEMHINRTLFKKLFLLGMFNIYLTNALEFWGLRYLSAAKTCFIYSLSPFVSAFLSYLIFGETLSRKKWVGLIIGIVGFLPILLQQQESEIQTGQVWFLSWAEISVLGAAICTVYGWIVMRQLVHEHNYSPFLANAWSMLLGGTMALVNSLFVENWNPMPYTEFWPFFDSMLMLIIISNLICYNLYGILLKRFTATFVSFAGFVTPGFTALFGWIYLSEEISIPFIVSSVIVFIGLMLFYQEELKREGIHRNPVVAAIT